MIDRESLKKPRTIFLLSVLLVGIFALALTGRLPFNLPGLNGTGNGEIIINGGDPIINGNGGEEFDKGITITNPTNGATVSGTITITVATQYIIVQGGVNFYIDGGYKYTDLLKPFQRVLDTTSYADGSHEIKVVCTEGIMLACANGITVAGAEVAEYYSDTIMVTVDNAPITEPPITEEPEEPYQAPNEADVLIGADKDTPIYFGDLVSISWTVVDFWAFYMEEEKILDSTANPGINLWIWDTSNFVHYATPATFHFAIGVYDDTANLLFSKYITRILFATEDEYNEYLKDETEEGMFPIPGFGVIITLLGITTVLAIFRLWRKLQI